jgi:GNAT acetyltransferase-like protein
LRITVLQEIPEDLTLQSQWNELVLRVENPQVFYTYEWSLAVQQAYGHALRPLLYLAHDQNDALCGLVSLALNPQGTRATFLCATTGDYCDFLSTSDSKLELVSSVLSDLGQRKIGEVTLTNLPANSTTVPAIKQISAQNGYHSYVRTAYICSQVRLSEIERRPGDNKLVLPGRKMVRRSLNALGRGSAVRLEHAVAPDAIASILHEFFDAHVARFSAMGRVSNLAQPERRRFLEELTRLLASPGWLALTRMMSGERVLAWNYGFRFQHTWFWYQPTFVTDLERFSPGFCLLSKLIEEAAEDPALQVVDLGLGAEEYKERFANQSRETLYVTLRQSLAKHVKEVLRHRATEAVRKVPTLENSTRRVISGLRRFQRRNSE